MPGTNGAELARCLSELKPGVPVLFMSGNATETSFREALEADPKMDGHELIWKPFTPSDLIARVRAIIDD